MATEDNNKKKGASKKKTPQKRKTTSAKLSGANIDSTISKLPEPLPPNIQIEEIIKQAFLRFYDNASLDQAKVKDLEHLDHIAEEYLKAYMILGYDINGEKVSILHAKNPHDKDALVEHLRTTLLNIIGNNEK